MHYHEINDEKDRLLHLLCAAYITDVLDSVIIEVLGAYSLHTVVEALTDFKMFKSGLTKIN